ncbi:hypothetical protein JYU34_008198 [Plutella xylostella]|uniref:Uncharacterized protein n=1 Tax=Plutella xylostella TaxID=51655 RepID=A0ABQ7QNY6_PLUXY|nr:hypothetical protein JYU34_008198 [Plutella xylostella]
MCDRMRVINQLQNVMSAIQGCDSCCQPPPCCNACCGRPCCPPCCPPRCPGSLVTVYNAILAIGQPPVPVAAFDKATIAIGCHHCKH